MIRPSFFFSSRRRHTSCGRDWSSDVCSSDLAGLVSGGVEVYNVPGAAGTKGLADLVTNRRGDPHHLMITGLVMVGGIVTNKSAVDLTQTTPIATLTAESEVVAVPASSKYTNLKQLLDDWKANPTSVKFGGGDRKSTRLNSS